MKTTSSINVDSYRKLVQTYLNLHVYDAALFWADKVVTLTGNVRDIYWLGQCMFLKKQFHRATHLFQSRNLDKSDLLCNYLTVRCFYEAHEFKEALKVINLIDFDLFSNKISSSPSTSMMDVSSIYDNKNQTFASILLLKGKVLESMDNRGLAVESYKQALQYDVNCFEAFDALIKYQMLTAAEEQELIACLPINEQCNMTEAEILTTLYESKLKKYHTPSTITSNETKLLGSIPSIVISGPNSVSTPNNDVVIKNDKNSQKSDVKRSHLEENISDNPILTRLKDSLDLHVAQAERLYYNCDYQKCSTLTEAILKQDPYHMDCLPIYISCQVELKQSNKLFSLAHNLVDLYPNLAISWFAVGCYYYINGKSDCARRYLSKATCLDRLFGPAWLAYGHSFAVENEHDQAMAAYFKASQLMKGCHLPLLYIGLECGLTNNAKLADKFFQQAQSIAPKDPFIMHEKGVIAYQNLDFKRAETYFREALERVKRIKNGLIPERWEPLLNNLGHTCRKLLKFEEALKFHQEALLLNPQSAGTYSAIAYVNVLIGHTDEAVDWFHKALGLKRDDTFSTTMLNYVIDQLVEEKPPYPGAPDMIPSFQVTARSNINTNISEALEDDAASITDMSMSIEINK